MKNALNVDFYYFSPTGGTKNAGEIFCKAVSENVHAVNLVSNKVKMAAEGELVILAAPVFGGRIPAIAIEKMKQLDGSGKKAVTLAVYGNRDYDDALLELNDTAGACGFQVLASAALIAQHSVVPEVGMGRPDAQDEASITEFASKVLEKLKTDSNSPVQVPGNRPYKEGMNMPVSPLSLTDCSGCGKCAVLCPMDAICMDGGKPETDAQKCILCMACVAHCPEKARILPPPLQETMNEKLGALKSVRNENVFFL